MADNLTGIENIYYEDDFNIVLIDPNAVVDSRGVKRPRTIKQENLIMYANLEADVVPRTRLAIGQDLETGVSNTVSVASIDNRLNFLKPKDKNYFDTSYTDEVTGARNSQGGTINQIKFNQGQNPQLTNYVDTQILGIRDINVQVQFNGVPTVTMTLIDVQGRSLFQTGGNSPYSVFLYYPYPMFRLTLKGFYGKSITYELMLLNFQASFEASSGNYVVNLKFISRTSAMLDDIRLGYLYALPHMYSTYTTSNPQIPNTTNTGTATVQRTGVGTTQELTVTPTSKGYSKLKQVFDRYKNFYGDGRGLIDKDVPVLTVNEMSERLKRYTEFLNREFEKLDFSNVVALDRYNDSVNNYSNELVEWGQEYLDYQVPLILSDKLNKQKIYPLKTNTINTSQVDENKTPKELAETKLNDILSRYLKIFNSVPGPVAKQITINNSDFTIDKFKLKFTESDINLPATYTDNTGFEVTNPNTDENYKRWSTEKINEIKNIGTLIKESSAKTVPIAQKNELYYTLDFQIANTKNIKAQIEQKRKAEVDRLNNVLKSKIRTNGNVQDLSFRPTVRNVIGVLMASVDAFYQLMSDVHDKAWTKKDDINRLKSVINDAPSQEGKNSVQNTTVNNPNYFVYPWPQFVQKKEIQGKTQYEVTYPGAESVKDFTKAIDGNIWPEVEFVEEYLKGVINKDKTFNSDVQPNTTISLKYTPEHAIELPLADTVYKQQATEEYVYEMYERLYMNVFYSGLFMFGNTRNKLESTVYDIEISNIRESNPQGILRDVLINEVSKSPSLYDWLNKTKGNGDGGELWTTFVSQNFVKDYIKKIIENSFDLLSPKEFEASSPNPIKLQSLTNIGNFLKEDVTKQVSLFDTYPFRIDSFSQKMVQKPNESERYKTLDTFDFDEKKLIITNFTTKNLRPYTRSTQTTQGFTDTNNLSHQTIVNFYSSRQVSNFFTEGLVTYSSDPNIGVFQSTSILNTPYFVNAVIDATSTNTITDESYTKIGYLLLNSLPLSTLYEKLLETKENTFKDFTYAGLNKFSAVHRLPYAWILKMGSVWYRYKKYVESENKVDILDSIWKDFDYKKAYDPKNSKTDRVYKIPYGTTDTKPRNYQLTNGNNIQNGFYPLVINSFYKLFTKRNLFASYSGSGNFDLETEVFTNLKLQSNTSPSIKFAGPMNSYYSYLDIGVTYQKYFDPSKIDYKLIFPSAGYIPFEQSFFEIRNENNTFTNISYSELVSSTPMFNGSVRALWNSPNFGWFNNSQIKKPTPYEYMKYVEPSKTQQSDFDIGQSYSSIEDLFGVFTKDQLDTFEYEFLQFCKEEGESKVFKPEEQDSKYKNIINLLKEMFIIKTADVDAKKIGDAQIATLTEVISKFIDIDVYLKIGNPKKYDRMQFGVISNNSKFLPKVPQNFYGGKYLDPGKPKLPSTTLTLQSSKNQFKAEWAALYEYVGFSTIDGISYGQTSTIYDFFIDNNIPFTVDNIKNLAPLIKIYATQKKLDNTFNQEKFQKAISEQILVPLETKRQQIENVLRPKLGNIQNIPTVETESNNSKLNGDVVKLEQYELFKSINDKWVSGINFNNKLLFDQFLFFDRANRDIGDDLIINVETIRKFCNWDNASTSIMSLIREVLVNNRMNFFVMPAYINFYGASTNKPQVIVNNANDVFGTFNYVDETSFSPKFLCQFIDRPSQTLSLDNDPNYPFKDDSFDLGNPTNNPIRQTQQPANQNANNKAVGFVVDFATMDQSVFKSVDINQEQGVTSSEQIQTIIDMGNQSAGKKTMQQTTALFDFYKNRSYNCTVKTLGNVMIQPTMYFVLRHMPMFNGTYVIRNVKHLISSGSFNTEFEGQRISANINTTISDELSSVNEDFSKKLEDKVKQFVDNNTLVTFDQNINQYLSGDDSKKFILQGTIPYLGFMARTEFSPNQDCVENVNAGYGSLSADTQDREGSINPKSLANEIKNVVVGTTDRDILTRRFLFSMIYLQGYETNIQQSLNYKNNNLYGMILDVDNFVSMRGSINTFKCLKTINGTVRPFASFNTIREHINMVASYFKNKTTDFDKINKNQTADVIDSFLKLFYESWYTSGPPVSTSNPLEKDNKNYSGWKTTLDWAIEQAIILGL